MSFLNRISPPSVFPVYLFPSFPLRRRKASADSDISSGSSESNASSTVTTEHISADGLYLGSQSSYLRCGRCAADLCTTSAIVSRGFTGRWGRAYLVSPGASESTSELENTPAADRPSLPNTNIHKPVPRQLVTGAHTVSDVSCVFCDSILGWKYVAAEEESQRYKVGKFILETKRISIATQWEDGAVPPNVEEALAIGAEDAIEFDSQDEDECEDLFAGVWSSTTAARRRQGRKFGRNKDR